MNFRTSVALMVVTTLGCLWGAPSHAEDGQASASSWFETQTAEEYRFILGGFSGHFTNWERKGLARFDGLSAKIWIDEIYGNEDDRWASIFRNNGVRDRSTLERC